jgi:predicted CxxxxCH...CXXCH cytochrome family protein
VHPIGYVDPRSDNFHGKDLERRGWAFSLCQSCHGDDFRGKANAPSCLNCHTDGPTACTTCHGQPPTTGAHDKHVSGRGLACAECHHVPATWDEPGHILDANGNVDPPPAEVTFGALANRDLMPPRRTAAATYDPATKQCSNVYCHGAILEPDSAATNTQPMWNGGAPAAACGTCHGKPPADHAQSECAMCHPKTVAADGTLSASHIDAVIDVGDGSSTCTGCHGSGNQPAPPRGLHGEQLTSDLAVGAHAAHLNANRVRGPIACTECHVVPASIEDPGHVDSIPGAQLVFGTLAKTDSAAPAYDPATGTCSGVYCHGGGMKLGGGGDPSPGKLAAQSWTATAGQTIYCGACHGLPPTDAFHAPTLQLTDCATCHPNTVGPFGNILVANGKHINGMVDF